MKLKILTIIVLLHFGATNISGLSADVVGDNSSLINKITDDQEEDVPAGPGTYHFIGTHSLKTALAGQIEEISILKNQISSILERLENEEALVNVIERNITGRLENLENEKNPQSVFQIETINIYEQTNCNQNTSSAYNGKEPHSKRSNLHEEFSNLDASLRAIEKRVAALEKKDSMRRVDKMESVYEAFEGSKTIIAKSPYSNRLYIFPMSEKEVFQSAKSYCEDRNTTLASIHSQGEYNFVKDWLSTHYKVYSHLWLGHQRPSSSASGSSDSGWHDGTTIGYTAWGPVDNGGRPNSFGCMFMCHYCGESINGWYIRPCNDKQHFLCQKVL